MALRVLTFLHSFSAGGVERIALRLHRRWQEDPGLDPILVMGRDAGPLRSSQVEGLQYIAPPDGGERTAAYETLWMIVWLRRQIVRHRPDVLFCPGNTYSIVAVAMKLLLGRRCPPIVLKVSNDLERPDMPRPVRQLYWRFLRLQGRLFDAFTGLATPMRTELSHRLAISADRITIIEDPALSDVEHSALQTLAMTRQPSPSGRHYLSIGRLERQKNFGLLIEAFARIAGPRDHLTILGEGSERAALTSAITATGLQGRVSLPGHAAVQPALAAADVFVLSSLYEAVPAVVIEALAAGLPVVSTASSVSMPSLIGPHGTVTPLGDANALAAAMQAQPPLTAAQRSAAAEAMRAFTLERAAHRYAALFRTLSPEIAILAH